MREERLVTSHVGGYKFHEHSLRVEVALLWAGHFEAAHSRRLPVHSRSRHLFIVVVDTHSFDGDKV